VKVLRVACRVKKIECKPPVHGGPENEMFYLMQIHRADFVPWVVLVIIAVSVISNIVKKLSQSGQPPKPGARPGATPGRKSFAELIDEVRRMADGEAGRPQPPKAPQPPGAVFTQPRQTPRPPGAVRTPAAPKLKPVAQVRQPAYRGPAIPKSRERVTTKRIVMSEAEIRDERVKEEAERKTAELRSRPGMERKQVRRPVERLSAADKTIKEMDRLKRRYDRSTAAVSAAAAHITDYSKLFGSPEALRNAIVLREILGPPRALRRFSSRIH
jgi:hypothetical protein